MIEHLVLFRWKSEATESQIDEIMTRLAELRSKIPGIIDLTCGSNFSERSQGYTHALTVRFTDKAALENYGPHPAHRDIVDNLINPIRGDVLSLDYHI